MTSSFANQISNRNFLSPAGFKFSIAKTPKVDFFCTTARIPEITMETVVESYYLKNLDVPGEKVAYGDLTLNFLVDENMENYMAVHNWLKGIGFPESPTQFRDQITNDEGIRDEKEVFSDGSLHILNSNFQDVAIVKFNDLFPISLTSLDFTASDTDINYFTAEAVFKYTVYNIVEPDGRTPL